MTMATGSVTAAAQRRDGRHGLERTGHERIGRTRRRTPTRNPNTSYTTSIWQTDLRKTSGRS